MKLSLYYKCFECDEELVKSDKHEHEYFCKKCNTYHDVKKLHKNGPVFFVKHGCPICRGDVKGNAELKYYCPHCNILYNDASKLKYEEPEEVKDLEEEPIPEAPIPLPPAKKIEFIDVIEGKVAITGVVREKGYLYFIDKKGDVSKVKMARSRADTGPRPHYKVLPVGLLKEKGYLYFLDKDGDIARAPMQRN